MFAAFTLATIYIYILSILPFTDIQISWFPIEYTLSEGIFQIYWRKLSKWGIFCNFEFYFRCTIRNLKEA